MRDRSLSGGFESARGPGPKPRPIIATHSSGQDRKNVPKLTYKLKSRHEGIDVQDDVCRNTVLECLKKMDEFRRLKTIPTVNFRNHELKYKR